MGDEMYEILYEEFRDAGPNLYAVPSNRVWVIMHLHSAPHRSHAVLEQRVITQGQDEKRSLDAFDGHAHTKAELQRMAIATFDALVANHPVLAQELPCSL